MAGHSGTLRDKGHTRSYHGMVVISAPSSERLWYFAYHVKNACFVNFVNKHQV